jgi:cytochrome bd-type quinol oxidase subunit 2
MNTLKKIGFLTMCLPTLFLGITVGMVQAGDPLVAPAAREVTLDNPLRVNSIEELLVAILNIIMVLMIPIIVFFIILAGFKYVTARGNSGQIEEATTTFTYAIIGGVLILAAVAIAEIIKNTVASFAA